MISYFKNVNTLRFIAALLVVIHHIEVYNPAFINHGVYNNFVYYIGKLAVVFFFVLSGFLITYLLLKEKHLTKKVSVTKFYKRRILRIWPVYYAVVFFGLFVHQHFHLFRIPGITGDFIESLSIQQVLMLLLFIPNIAFLKGMSAPYTEQTWSIGVEEQFYSFWPWIFKYANNIKKTLLLIIVFSIITKISLFCLQSERVIPTILYDFFNSFSLSSFAIGALGAWTVFYQEKWLTWFKSKLLQYTFSLLLVLFLIFSPKIPLLYYEFYSILFILLILISIHPQSIFNFEWSVTNYLGKISYGIYMYHLIAMEIANKIMYKYGFQGSASKYTLTIILTIIIASISYELMEKRILKYKEKF